MSDQNRRKSERLRFDKPLGARFETVEVTIVDISFEGARIEHDFPLPAGKRVKLDFFWEENEISLRCLVIRCKLEKRGNDAIYSSGVRFDGNDEETMAILRDYLKEIVERDFAARRAVLQALA